MTINDHQSLLNITVGPQRWLTETDQCFLFPVWQLTAPLVPPGLRIVRCHQSGDSGARFPWLEPDRPPGPCLPVTPWPCDQASSTWYLAMGHRRLLTTWCAHVSLEATIPGHRETSTVDSLEGKQRMFRSQSCLPGLPSPVLSHSVPPSHTNLMLLRSSHCPGWLGPGPWLSLSPVPLCHETLRHLSRCHGCDVWQYALHCDNGCNPPHNVFCCGSTWRLATTTISSAWKPTYKQ